MPSDLIARRDELQAQRKSSYGEYSDATNRRQQAERGLAEAQRKVREATAQHSRGLTSAKVLEAAEAEEDKARDLVKRETEAANRYLDAHKDVDAQLAEIYADRNNVGDFALEADRVSRRADAALGDLADAFYAAREAWEAAQAAWSPICAGQRIPGVPAFPLTEHAMGPLLTGEAARPPGIEVWSEDALAEAT